MAKAKETSAELVKPSAPSQVLMRPDASTSLAPDFMHEAGTDGTEMLGKFIRPDRVKVVQKNSEDQYLEKFSPGDLVLTPSMALVSPVKLNEGGRPSDRGEPFAFVPLYFFPEWITVNPMQLKGSENFIRDRSRDYKSDIARKAKSPDTWSEPHPARPELKVRHIEVLNFLVIVLGHPELMEPVILGFSKSGHKDGSRLAKLIKMRTAPMYGCVFEGQVGPRSNAQGQWYGVDVRNPQDTAYAPFIQDRDEFLWLKSKYEELKRIDIVTEYDENFDNEEPSVAPSADAEARF